jgi:hypothetical protein
VFFAERFSAEMAGVARTAAQGKIYRFITSCKEVALGMTAQRI